MPISEASGGTAQAVYDQLSANFPASAIGWVKDADWSGPRKVPAKDVDTGDRDSWSASHQPGEVAAFTGKLRKRQRKDQELKPVILVRRPGDGKLLIADGHHRFLAYEKDGQAYVWAYVGTVGSEHGKWDSLALSQKRQDKAA
jgi:hypothetical protein